MEKYDLNVIERLGISPEICSVEDSTKLHRTMLDLRQKLYLAGLGQFYPHYRSEQFYGWDITPGIFRNPAAHFTPAEAKALERKAIDRFQGLVSDKIGPQAFRDIFDKHPNGRSWDLLFQAQHCGLKTTLIDWTMNIAPSLFFGVEESTIQYIEESDGQLWVFMLPGNQLLNTDGNEDGKAYFRYDPFTLTEGFMTNVPIYLDDLEERICEQRISRQGGRFYISAADTCNIPMNKQPAIAQYLFRFKIPAKCKKQIRTELNDHHINHETTYVKQSPEHDAIAATLNKEIFGFS
jgi:hypothetical protein